MSKIKEPWMYCGSGQWFFIWETDILKNVISEKYQPNSMSPELLIVKELHSSLLLCLLFPKCLLDLNFQTAITQNWHIRPKDFEIFLRLLCCRIGGGKNIEKQKNIWDTQ